MASVNYKAIEALGLDHKKVKSIASRLERLGREAREMNLIIFLGSGCNLRTADVPLHLEPDLGPIIVADLNIPNGDGGCGAQRIDHLGFMRGETA